MNPKVMLFTQWPDSKGFINQQSFRLRGKDYEIGEFLTREQVNEINRSKDLIEFPDKQPRYIKGNLMFHIESEFFSPIEEFYNIHISGAKTLGDVAIREHKIALYQKIRQMIYELTPEEFFEKISVFIRQIDDIFK